jgi:hypothetical protein
MAASTIALLTVIGTVIFPKSYRVATWSLPAGASTVPEARANTGVAGELGGRINDDGTACFWLLGDGQDRVALMWPPRYSAHGTPLTIFSQNGQAVATVGEFVTLDGAVSAPDDIQGNAITGCPKMSLVVLVGPQPARIGG